MSITGGKLTTYRHMAADTVDEVVHEVLGDAAPAGSRHSRTKRLRLRGADGHERILAGGRRGALDAATMQHLAGRFGGEADSIITLVAQRPELGEPLVPGLPYIKAEAIFAVRHEMARSVDDVLSRRTRARLFGRADAANAAEAVADLIAPELGWTAEQAAESAAEFRSLCEHERDSAGLEDVLLAGALHPVPAAV